MLTDPVYFMRKYVKIQHPIRGTIAFDLYPFQAKTLEEFANHDFNIVLKSRQWLFRLWLLLIHFGDDIPQGQDVLIISIKQEVSKESFPKFGLPMTLCLHGSRLNVKKTIVFPSNWPMVRISLLHRPQPVQAVPKHCPC